MKRLLFPAITLVLFFSACAGPGGNDAQRDKLLQLYLQRTLPAQQALTEFRVALSDAQLNLVAWIETPGAHGGKTELRKFTDTEYPRLKAELLRLEQDSAFETGAAIRTIVETTDKLVVMYKDIMGRLGSVEQYQDPVIVLPVRAMVLDNDGECALTYSVAMYSLREESKKLAEDARDQLELARLPAR